MPKKQGKARVKELAASAYDAKRSAGFAKRQRDDFARMTRGKRGTALALAVAEHAAKWAGRDDGPGPEHNRQQQISAAQTLAKVADPERVIAEQALLIAKLTAALQSKRDGHAVPVASSGPGASAPATH